MCALFNPAARVRVGHGFAGEYWRRDNRTTFEAMLANVTQHFDVGRWPIYITSFVHQNHGLLSIPIPPFVYQGYHLDVGHWAVYLFATRLQSYD